MLLTSVVREEKEWLDHVSDHLTQEIKESALSWAAFHASKYQNSMLPSVNSMLPLFRDEASSFAMLRHCLLVVQAAIHHFNPGQTPVICVDQPLFAKLKQIQWSDETYSEDNFVILFGGFHIEMTALKVLGNLLQGSGWTEMVLKANISSAGTADSFLTASHVTRTRNAHQITACALHILMTQAFTEAKETDPDIDPGIDFDAWCALQKEKSPQFLFWTTCLDLQLLVFSFVRAIRTANFKLYVSALNKLVPWFFTFNHTHYARWISVHLRDMMILSEKHPDVYRQFKLGKFVVAKSKNNFSLISVDQGHEQNNAVLKNDGGIIGLTQDSDALVKWTISGPETVRVIAEFEKSIVGKSNTIKDTSPHHQETKSAQIRFAKQVTSMVDAILKAGNPLSSGECQMIRLHSREVMPDESVTCLKDLQARGEREYGAFVKDRLVDRTTAVSELIQRNKVTFFNEQPIKFKPKGKEMISELKSEASLFSRLYVSCQRRDGNMDEFFRHEHQPFPPSLSTSGSLRQSKKSDLVNCLEELMQPVENRPPYHVSILDGAVIVNMLKPGMAKTFGQYSESIFCQYLKSELSRACRVDVVWDIYIPNSLKSQAPLQRLGCPVKVVRVQTSSPIPGKWHEFLRNDQNKTELFSFLTESAIASIDTSKELVMTDGTGVSCKPLRETSAVAPCNHEEADSRMMVHVTDAFHRGYKKIQIRSVDTDVVVLAVSTVSELGGGLELWVAFGTGKDFRLIAAHEIAESLGPMRCYALPMFHSLTGCDTTSYFQHIGKRTAWKIWKLSDMLTTALCSLRKDPKNLQDNILQTVERFVILLYDRTSSVECIDAERKDLFVRKGRQLSLLPPTKAALYQHILRSILQAGFYWGRLTSKSCDHPSPGLWGWTCPDKWKPMWTLLPDAASSCKELIHCRCRSRCIDCKCAQAGLKCIAFCMCKGDCENI